MTEGALQERPQGKEISCKVTRLAWAEAFPWWGPSGRPHRRGKRHGTAPHPQPQLKSGKPNLKADTGEQLRLPRYFISQRELKSEAHTHGTARRPESGDGREPGSSFPICLPVCGQRPSRDLASGQDLEAEQGSGSWAGRPCPVGGNRLAPLIPRRGSRLREHPHGMAEREA